MRRSLASLTLIAFAAGCSGPTAMPDGAPPPVEPTPAMVESTPAMATAAIAPTLDASAATMPATGVLALVPLALPDCEAVHGAVTTAVGVTFSGPIDAPFTDEMTGNSGTACTMEADGTGVDFESPMAVMTKIQAALAESGWTEDVSRQADGPTGTATGFTRGADLLIASATWEPSGDANCPPDQPIVTCPLTPGQKIYQVRLYGLSGTP